MKRREVLRVLTNAAALPLAGHLLPADWLALGRDLHATIAAAQASPFRGLDADAVRTIGAACERIIPSDDTPGAVAAGVPEFIDRVLTDWCEPAERTRLLDGLQLLDTRSREANGVPFADSTEEQQTALLMAFDGELDEWRRRPVPTEEQRASSASLLPEHWFGMLKFLTIWGYFTSEVAQRQELGLYPPPSTFDGCAPYAPRRRSAPRAAGETGPPENA